MNKYKYVEGLCALDLMDSLPVNFLSKTIHEDHVNLKNNLFDLLDDESYYVDCSLYLTSDYIESSLDQSLFIFQLGIATPEYVDMLLWNDKDCPIKIGDSVLCLHMDVPTLDNNPNSLSVRDLFVSGLQGTKSHILRMSDRPDHVICFSHLAAKLSLKYGCFKNYHITKVFQEFSSPSHYFFNDLVENDVGSDEIILLLEDELLGETDQQLVNEITNELSYHKSVQRMLNKYSPSDISLAVTSVDDFLAYDFS